VKTFHFKVVFDLLDHNIIIINKLQLFSYENISVYFCVKGSNFISNNLRYIRMCRGKPGTTNILLRNRLVMAYC
jgi:hypothetical protein